MPLQKVTVILLIEIPLAFLCIGHKAPEPRKYFNFILNSLGKFIKWEILSRIT